MTTKVTIGNATPYHGDCMGVLQHLEEQVDALITDPPYSSGGMVRGECGKQPNARLNGQP